MSQQERPETPSPPGTPGTPGPPGTPGRPAETARPQGGPPSGRPGASGGGRPAPPPPPQLAEVGGPIDGKPQMLDRRLFMQLLVFGDCLDPKPLMQVLESANVQGALYEQVHDPRGVGLLTMSEDPAVFTGSIRHMLNEEPFASLSIKHDFSMFGRTYSIGYEPNLEETLFDRPTRTGLHPDWPWVVWYPLRRRGSFVSLPPDEQRKILMEHGTIGRSFGEADYAHDIRLACHGMDPNDNDFVIGLTGKELHPLSAIVQRMRQTVQTSQYLEKLGPFFVGRTIWKAPLK